MCTNKMLDVCICVLAHNEQTHIADTLRSLVAESDFLACEIKVYANGCTDDTVKIVQELSRQYPRISLVELEIASKANAWNAAFLENSAKILIFSDGDVRPENRAISGLCEVLSQKQTKIVLAGCTLWPDFSLLSIEQKFVGFLQVPLHQDFLSGGLYAINRSALMSIFLHHGLSSLPAGLVGEDTFLEKIVPSDQFIVIPLKVYYQPPVLKDYWRYLARLRWQADQLALLFNSVDNIHVDEFHVLSKFIRKVKLCKSFRRILLGLFSVCLRRLVVLIKRRDIDRCVLDMGIARANGNSVLAQYSRSVSVK